MWHHHKVSLDQFDDFIPWERDLYVSMLVKKVEEDNERRKLEIATRRAQGR